MTVDEEFMRRALDLATRGRGFVEPNPLVGAVLVRNGSVVGEGYHQRFGEAHAEVHALGTAGAAARGATLYVTLEPCCHPGKTPPCTEAIIAAGVGRVVAAMVDPFERVAGAGLDRLRAAGIEVDTGLLEAAARRLNAPYAKLLAAGQPYVHAKWAMSLDGKLATATGQSRWISGPESRRLGHELRGRMDAIVIGIGTALADDPLLTARPPGPRVALRVVLDSRARLPLDGHLARTARDLPVLVATTDRAAGAALDALRGAGCECLPLPGGDAGVSIPALLGELGRRRFTNVLVEGGATVLGSFLDARAIDAVHAFVAPKLVGGMGAPSAIGGRGIAALREALELDEIELSTLGQDCLIRGCRPLGGEGRGEG